MPSVERRRKSRLKPDSCWLRSHARNVRSQFGEDGILAEIFRCIGEKTRWCVEFGAWDGEHLSNTWRLLQERHWSGVLIEGDAARADVLAAKYAGSADRVSTLRALVGWEGDSRFDRLLATTPAPADLDLLSIDIDGNDWHVWNAIEVYRPRVVVVEFNPTVPNDVVFVQDADPGISQGCSLLALIELGRRKGYELAATTECNGIFVLAEEFAKLGISDNDIDSLHDCSHDLVLFHGYDGTFFAAGEMVVNWFGIPLTHEDFQVLPRAARRYPGDDPNFVKPEKLRSGTARLIAGLSDYVAERTAG